MRRVQEITPFIVRLASGRQYVLQYALPRERETSWNITLGQAVESSVPQLFGDAQRVVAPVDIDAYVFAESRIAAARAVSELDLALTIATQLEFAEIKLPLLRAHRFAMAPIIERDRVGFRVGIRFYGAQHEFTDSSGRPVALV